MSFAFDEAYYLKSKLQQLIKTDAATYGNWNTDQVKQAIEDAGMTVEGHYHQYSLVEGTSCNPYFNTTEYLEAKLAQLKSVDPAQYNNWTVDDVVKAFQDAGFTSAEDHYNMYGCKETDANGYLINPSNAFDANAYVQAKLAQLVATDPETYGEWTAEDVVEAIADAGMTPVEHFEEYGKAEGQAAGIDMVQTVPVTQRVANDDLRDGMNENVPSNYNKPVDAPKHVDASEAGSVDKPCDMATTTDKPADPVATPADSDYVAVPGGGIADTNENPVELVTAEVKDTEGNTVATASEYGVASTTKDGDGNTVKTVQPVDENGAVNTKADPIQTVTTSEDGKTQTTETKVTDAQGNTVEVAEKVTTADDGSTVTDTVATATDADGNQTAKTETRVAADADGEVTGTNTSYTDEGGKTSTDSTGEDPGTPEDPTPEPEPEPTPADSGSGATADTEAPTVTGVTMDGAKVTVQFSEKVVEVNSANTAGHVKVAVGETAEAAVSTLNAPESKLSADGKSYTFTLNNPPAAGQVVKVKIDDGDTFQDTSLNKMAAMEEAVASDPVPASGDLTVEGSTTITVSGQAKGDVVIDPTAGTVTENGEAVTVESTVATAMATATKLNVSGTGFESTGTITLNNVPVATLEVDTSDLATTTVNWVKDSNAENFVIGGSATKPASTVVKGLDSTDTASGTFTVGSLEVTKGKVGLVDSDTASLDGTAAATMYKGAAASVATGITDLKITGTNAVDLSNLTDIDGSAIKTMNLDTGAAVKLTEAQLSALTGKITVAANTQVLTVTDATELDIATFSDNYTVNTAEAGTVTVSANADVSGGLPLFGANVKSLNVTSGTVTDTNAAGLIGAFSTAGNTLTVASGATINTAQTSAITLGAGTVSFDGTLGLTGASGSVAAADGVDVTLGTVTSTGALTVAGGTPTDGVGSLTVKNVTTSAAAIEASGKVTIQNVAAATGVNGSANADTIDLTLKTATDNLAIDLKAGADSLTLGAHGVATVTHAQGDGFTGTAVITGDTQLTGIDVYKGLEVSDKVVSGSLTFAAGPVEGGTTHLAATTANGLALVTGSYDATTGKFTAGERSASANLDYLVEIADGTNIYGFVLDDMATTVTLVGSGAADGTFTLTDPA